MSYLVLARKWRPQTFEEVLGQEATVRTLKNAILRERVAHAFLFSGPRGVGKTSLARVLAKALNCLSFPGPTVTPCGTCASCVEIAAGSSVDVLEIDGASNRGIDNIRELRDTVRYMPAASRRKVYIIDEVHMLTTESFNALLKTLEEPPPHVVFIFATTEAHKVPATILSRCQRYDFHRVGREELVVHLKKICERENLLLPESALRVIAGEAEGSVRDALSLLDQVASFGGEGLSESEVLRLLGVVDQGLISGIGRAVLKGNAAEALDLVAEADAAGHDIKQLARGLLRWFRNLLTVKISATPQRLVDATEQELAELQDLAREASLENLERFFDQTAKLEEGLARSGLPRLLLEVTLVKMAVLPPLVPVEELIARMEDLEHRLKTWAGSETDRDLPLPAPLFQVGRESAASGEAAAGRPAADEEGCHGDLAVWQAFLSSAEKHEPRLAAFLSQAKFLGRSGREWRVAYPSTFAFLDRLKNPHDAKRINELLSGCFGEGQRLIISDDESVAPPQRISPYQVNEQKRREAVTDPVVQALMEKMRGEIEEIKIKK